ncbi:hypothetical protein PGT21_022406 [Puccinia graminis f. sp. tritici]|uniref:Uncharacterized protein n=1 Tax=Puccinia graminis f. sp. tritici TaxID=56615 RepID=A0A5B0P8H1_PUCGR|nr:hypothetical protein PGT21_022406 [Puccinia graminis f. sp. tritici]KAA1117173.1 hypothetical protein PGTUg99_036680 [Puccinia graminis f. sp. tritici]
MSCVLWCGSLDSRLTNNSPTKTRNTSSGDARLESQTRSSPGRIGPLAPDLGLGHGTGLDIRRGKRYAATIVAPAGPNFKVIEFESRQHESKDSASLLVREESTCKRSRTQFKCCSPVALQNRSDSEETDSLDHWSFRALYKSFDPELNLLVTFHGIETVLLSPDSIVQLPSCPFATPNP